MNPLVGIVDTYDIHVPWRNFCLNLWGMGSPELVEADQQLVKPIQWAADDLLDFITGSLT